jgi:hypothetical protein
MDWAPVVEKRGNAYYSALPEYERSVRARGER